MNGAPLPDAPPANWVDRYAPAPLRPWLQRGRFDRPIGIWLLLLPGWQGIALALAQYEKTPDLYDAWLFVAFAIGACLMRAAGCAFNDIVDRDIDAKVARTAGRPIPSGRISVRQAWLFIIACALTSFVILLTLNLVAVVLGVASLALVAAYPFMKRITWWPQAWLGLTFNWGALMGFAAAATLNASRMFEDYQLIVLRPMLVEAYPPDKLDLLTDPIFIAGQVIYWGPAFMLYAAGVIWTLGYDTIYALQDVEDDALAGVKSSARRLGGNAPRAISEFYGISLLFAAAMAFFAGLGPLVWVFLLALAAHFIWQVRRLKLDDPALALRLFKSNREAGLILLLGIVAGAWRI